jgi:hypothetical protein
VFSRDPTKEEVHGPTATQPELDGGSGTNRGELSDERKLSMVHALIVIH